MPNTLPFRSVHPIRCKPEIKSVHTQYFEILRADFNSRCGYCDSFDLRRNNDFEIDHFRPRRILTKIKSTDYSNLVYSCKSCNRSKSGKWPSNDENISVVEDTGFIDPVDENYCSHFIRNDNGEIYWQTPLGKWMYTELALFNIQHSVLWMLEKIKDKIEEAKEIRSKNPDNKIMEEAMQALYEIQDNYLNKLFNV